jgi:YbgC/YbaW family acyl-CoA thioester hydrolase
MPFAHPIEVRFSDLDTLEHVNNAVLVSFIEQARWQWWRGHLAGRPFKDEGFLIARVEVDYRAPIFMGDDVRVELHCDRVGRTSFDLAYRVTRGPGGDLLAEARTVQVMLDFDTQRPAELRPGTRAWLEAGGA